MRFIGVLFLVICLCFIFRTSVNGQDNRKQNKRDTIHEVIVYEYDTIYVAADTVKLTDTVVHYQIKNKQVTSKKNNFDFLNNFNILKSFNERWSLGVGVHTFVSDAFHDTYKVDSFLRKRTLNSTFEFHVNYQADHFKYSLGIGFLPYHEQLKYQKNSFISSTVSSNGSYDSLLIKSNAIADNYYQYLVVFLNLGRRWGKQTVFFVLNGYISSHILLSSKAIFPISSYVPINSSLIQKIGYQVGFNPCIGFKIRKQFELTIGPFCDYAILNKKKYPYNDQVTLGLNVRIQ
jgi:hypothetical protein